MKTIKCPNCSTEIPIDEVLKGEFNQNLEQHRLSIQKEVERDFLLQMRGQEKIIGDLKAQLDEALRKANQSSVQRQGELMEQEIIRILQESFPEDNITQTKKGSNGADILQVVKNQEIVLGKIYYESKNTKSWSNEWIPKLKSDNLKTQADVLVIISNVLPKDIERCGVQDGVWVCSFDYFKELTKALRFTLLKLHAISIVNKGRPSKVERLYSYLTSAEFKTVFESIIEGFQAIQESHQSEQITLKRMWTKREKLMKSVLFSSIEFYTNLRTISATAIPEIKMLETPQTED